jgi:phenylpropionate dioxygenase-like ring-hydroxylating dioxygenase large terminal subunit/uncharacterized protein (DUF2141 family)
MTEPTTFEGFAEQWTPIELGARLGRGRALSITLAGVEVALFRTKTGEVGAVVDRCPHRGARLSLGEVTPEGKLACPFHGWEFDRQGACTRVPLCDTKEAQRGRFGVLALPVREIGPLIWVYTGHDARGTEPDVPASLIDAQWVHWSIVDPWRTHWTRAMENMLDMPHLGWVHRRTIGRQMRVRADRGDEMEVRTIDEPWGFRIEGSTQGGEAIVAGLEWRRPNGMILRLSSKPGRQLLQHVYCVPETRETTRMILVTARDFGRYNPFMRLFDAANPIILAEDRGVVESIRPREVPHPSEEKSVATDEPTLRFRRWYLKHLAARRNDVVPEGALVRTREAEPAPSPAAASATATEREHESGPRPAIGVATVTLLLLALGALALFGASRGLAQATTGTRLVVSAEGFHSDRGHLRCLLYDRGDGYPTHPERAMARASGTITARRATCTFPNVTAGRYAVALIHDEDDDQQLDTGLFGIPTEGTGASRDARGSFGPPSFDAAAFDVSGVEVRQAVHMVYL